ncbi:phosphotransferase [Nocardia sp. ET3-3]|uniref:Phosphotransferase n=1 Tax=Nocardia terrae TaxID=2675851 RepID=A0A7K1UQP4_9NOCA|nr:phosphotransferase [Nocardia terrae]MVU76670.1 phosphotransferase [Nocardia terrae]
MLVTGLSGESYEVDSEPFYAAGSRAVQYLCRDPRGQQRLYKLFRTPANPTEFEWARQAMLFGRQTVLAGEAAGGSTGNPAEAVNWPIDLVQNEGTPPGVVLPLIPMDYLQPDGRPRTFDQLWAGQVVAAEFRTALATRLCEIVRVLEERGLVHGDLSPKNVLFHASAPLAYVIDTAGLRPADAAYDRYKDRYDLAMLVYRTLFLGQPSAGYPADLDPRLRALFDRAFGNGGFGPDARPSAQEWFDTLRAVPVSSPAMPTVALTAPAASPTGWSNPQQPLAYSPAPQSNSTNTALKVILGALLVVLVIAIAVGAVVLSGKSSDNNASPTSTTTAATTTTTAPPTTTTAGNDTSTLNSQATDKTPFTADALLPVTFTDSNNVTFTRTSYGAKDTCVSSNMSQNVKTALQNNNCQRLMTGVYLDTAQQIQVSIEVFAFNSDTDSDAVYSTLKGQDQTWDIWCPTDGVGASVCKANKDTWLAAAYSSWGRQQYRYLFESYALYVNLSTDTSLNPNLDAPAHKVIQVVGPCNYSKTC